jgi:hypothetical protein
MVVATLFGVASACSSGGGTKNAEAPRPSPTTTGAASTQPASSVNTVFTGQGSAAYCGLARNFSGAFDKIGQPGSSTADLRAYYQAAGAAVQQSVGVAPAEIRPDVQVVADALQSLIAALDKINYDLSKISSLPPDLIAKLMSQPFEDSSVRVAAYAKNVCGIGG